MPAWVRVAVVVAGVAVGVGSLVAPRLPMPLPAPAPVPAAGVLAGLDSKDAGSLRDFYAAMADIVQRDGQSDAPACKSTLDLRNRHAQALAMAFAHTGMVGKYSGLGDRLDAYLLEAIGSVDVPLTPELRAKAAQAFAAIK